MRRGVIIVFAFALAVSLFGSALISIADENISGDWTGDWSRPEGKKTGGHMRMSLTQKGHELTGSCVMDNTTWGDVEGDFDGKTSEGKFSGIVIGEGAVTVDMEGTCEDGAIDGSFHSRMLGKGSFTLRKE